MHLVNLINTCQNGKLDCTCMHVPFPKIEKKDKNCKYRPTSSNSNGTSSPIARGNMEGNFIKTNQVHAQLTNKKYFKYRTNVISP